MVNEFPKPHRKPNGDVYQSLTSTEITVRQHLRHMGLLRNISNEFVNLLVLMVDNGMLHLLRSASPIEVFDMPTASASASALGEEN